MPEIVFLDWRILLGVVLTSFLLTPLIRHYALRRHLLDMPNDRSSHVLPTPRGGGLAIVTGYFAGLIIISFLHNLPFDFISALAGAGIMIAIIGFLDDHYDMSATWRIVVHFISAVWAVSSLNGFSINHDLSTAGWFLNLFWIISIVWLINLYNFMDGIDTIAGAEAIFISISATILFLMGGEYSMASAAALLTAAVGGFLFWNLPPARIFMGDVGSGFIGIVVGVIALAGIKKGITSVWVWLILLGTFIIDATITVGRRMIKGEKWYSAHRSHAYQHAARRLGSHGKVTTIVTVINMFWLFPWAAAAYKWPNIGIICFIISYVPLVCLAICLGAGRNDLACTDDSRFKAYSERSMVTK
jgi:Fuc2NAc and GlcNAc transferase